MGASSSAAAGFAMGASSIAAAAVGNSERPLDLSRIILDAGPAKDVLSLWRRSGRLGSGDGRSRSQARRIARALPYRTYRVFLGQQFGCVATEAEVARALELPDSGICGLGMDPAYQKRDSIAAIADMIDARNVTLRTSIANDVARYLPTDRSWKPVRVWFLVASGSMFDAATLKTSADGDSVPVILINLTEVLTYGESIGECVNALTHVLAHEVFHAGMRQVERGLPGWGQYQGVPDSDLGYIAKVMLDEGVAHYIDWRARPESDSLFTWKPSTRETHAFSRLANACRRLKQGFDSRVARLEVLQLAGNGPLWSKYAAISGMFAAHRIEMARGLEVLRRVVAEGPWAFLKVYAEVAGRNPRLGPLPKELIP